MWLEYETKAPSQQGNLKPRVQGRGSLQPSGDCPSWETGMTLSLHKDIPNSPGLCPWGLAIK